MGPKGAVHEVTFWTFFSFGAVLGPKCLQELPQESPEPLQASIVTSFCRFLVTFWSFFDILIAEEHRKQTKKKASIPSCFSNFWATRLQAQYRIVTEPFRPPVLL